MIGINEKEIESLRRIKWWREYQARQMLSIWNQSGMSLLGFCRRYAIGYKRVLRWRHLLEVLLGNGRIIRIHPGFHSESLRQLLAMVEDSSCG